MASPPSDGGGPEGRGGAMLTWRPMGPGGPLKPRVPSSPLAPKCPWGPLAPGSPSAPCKAGGRVGRRSPPGTRLEDGDVSWPSVPSSVWPQGWHRTPPPPRSRFVPPTMALPGLRDTHGGSGLPDRPDGPGGTGRTLRGREGVSEAGTAPGDSGDKVGMMAEEEEGGCHRSHSRARPCCLCCPSAPARPPRPGGGGKRRVLSPSAGWGGHGDTGAG